MRLYFPSSFHYWHPLKADSMVWNIWEVMGLTFLHWPMIYALLRVESLAFYVIPRERRINDLPFTSVWIRNISSKYWIHVPIRFLGLLSLSLLLFPQCFARYVLRPSSGVCRTREPSRNFKLRPLLKPRRSPVLIPLAITGYKC